MFIKMMASIIQSSYITEVEETHLLGKAGGNLTENVQDRYLETVYADFIHNRLILLYLQWSK